MKDGGTTTLAAADVTSETLAQEEAGARALHRIVIVGHVDHGKSTLIGRLLYDTGSLPPEHSFVGIEPGNVIITAMKKAEDDNGLIIRFYEFAGKETQVSLRLPPGAVRAVETNLMEKEEKAVEIGSNGLIQIPTRAYEIKTVKVQFAPPAK